MDFLGKFLNLSIIIWSSSSLTNVSIHDVLLEVPTCIAPGKEGENNHRRDMIKSYLFDSEIKGDYFGSKWVEVPEEGY